MSKLIPSKIEIQAKTGINLILSFATLLVVNTLVIIIANRFFPNQVVLGTYSISYWWALYHSVVKLTLIGTLAMPLVALYEWKKNTIFTPQQWMASYMVVNVIALWGISRFAQNLGLGISSWIVVVLLAALLDWVQGMAMMAAGKYMMKC